MNAPGNTGAFTSTAAASAISVAGADAYLGETASGTWAATGTGEPLPIASITKLITTGKVRYKAARPIIDDVFVYGDTAIVVGSMELDVSVGGADRTVSGRYTDVWVLRDGRWQMVGWQSTRIP